MEFCMQFCVLLHRVMCSDLEFSFEFIITWGTLPIWFCCYFLLVLLPLSSSLLERTQARNLKNWSSFHNEGLISQSLSGSKYLGHIERSRYTCNCESLLIFFSQNGGIIFCCSLKGKQGLRRILWTASNSTPDQIVSLITYASNLSTHNVSQKQQPGLCACLCVLYRVESWCVLLVRIDVLAKLWETDL